MFRTCWREECQVLCHRDLLLDYIQFINRVYCFMDRPVAIGTTLCFAVLLTCPILNDRRSTMKLKKRDYVFNLETKQNYYNRIRESLNHMKVNYLLCSARSMQHKCVVCYWCYMKWAVPLHRAGWSTHSKRHPFNRRWRYSLLLSLSSMLLKIALKWLQCK